MLLKRFELCTGLSLSVMEDEANSVSRGAYIVIESVATGRDDSKRDALEGSGNDNLSVAQDIDGDIDQISSLISTLLHDIFYSTRVRTSDETGERTLVQTPALALTPTQPGADMTPTQPGADMTPTQPGADMTPTQPGADIQGQTSQVGKGDAVCETCLTMRLSTKQCCECNPSFIKESDGETDGISCHTLLDRGECVPIETQSRVAVVFTYGSSAAIAQICSALTTDMTPSLTASLSSINSTSSSNYHMYRMWSAVKLWLQIELNFISASTVDSFVWNTERQRKLAIRYTAFILTRVSRY